MSVQIIVDLIPLLGAILSGLFAFIGSRSAANLAKETQLKTAAQEAFISARLNAYLSFEDAFARWSYQKNEEANAAVYKAENTIRLVGSEDTIIQLAKLTELVRTYETSNALPSFDAFASAHAAALICMRNDLMHYPIPKPELIQNQ